MIVVECVQLSQEWFNAKAGVISASNFRMCRERLKTGPNAGDFKKEAKKHAFQLAVERISGEPLKGTKFQTWEMENGSLLEADARLRHEREIGEFIAQTGIVLTDDKKYGASADGLIETLFAGAEYKCLTSPEGLMEILLDQDISDYKDQIQGGMWLTGREEWHFALYCPALAPIGKDFVLFREQRDNEYIHDLEQDLVAFDRLVEDYRERLVNVPTRIGFDEIEEQAPAPHEIPPETTSNPAAGIFEQ